MLKKFNGEKIFFSTNSARTIVIHMQKRILLKAHTLYSTLFQSSCRLSIKHETVKVLEGNIGDNLNLRVDKFIDRIAEP